MKIIPDKSIDMILCDLPYGTTACKWDVIIPFEPLWAQYKRIIKDKGCIALFGQEPFSSYLRLSNIKWYKYDWIWVKEHGTLFQVAKYQPMIMNELISIFGKNTINYFPITEKLDSPKKEKLASSLSKSSPLTYINKGFRLAEFRYPKNVLNFARDKQKIHSTQKPINLLSYLIKTYTKENEIVLDNCMGSGSSIVTCNYINRKSIGIEMDKDIFELAIKRIKNPEQIIKEKKNKYSLFEDYK
jgi:site-specific DNA-methyltransferase (adenine-specific)